MLSSLHFVATREISCKDSQIFILDLSHSILLSVAKFSVYFQRLHAAPARVYCTFPPWKLGWPLLTAWWQQHYWMIFLHVDSEGLSLERRLHWADTQLKGLEMIAWDAFYNSSMFSQLTVRRCRLAVSMDFRHPYNPLESILVVTRRTQVPRHSLYIKEIKLPTRERDQIPISEYFFV